MQASPSEKLPSWKTFARRVKYVQDRLEDLRFIKKKIVSLSVAERKHPE